MNIRSHCLSHQRPATLETSAPVNSMKPKTSTTPKPGMWDSLSKDCPNWSELTADKAMSKRANRPSSTFIIHSKTQMVIARGNQTINPVSRYFLIGTVLSRGGVMGGCRFRSTPQAQHSRWQS